MSAPKRIQLRRTKGWRKPEGAIVVARPTKWGNPYKVGGQVLMNDAFGALHLVAVENNQVATDVFRAYLRSHPQGIELADVARAELAGHDLACWCKPGEPCHADVLLEIANGGAS